MRIVLTMPWYLGILPGVIYCSYNLTLAVSVGIVATSAIIAAVEAIKMPLTKKDRSPSPYILFVFMTY